MVKPVHALPFRAKFTDALFDHLCATTNACHGDEPDMLLSISWCAFEARPKAGTKNWALQFYRARLCQTGRML